MQYDINVVHLGILHDTNLKSINCTAERCQKAKKKAFHSMVSYGIHPTGLNPSAWDFIVRLLSRLH